jgi:hypothetical protein
MHQKRQTWDSSSILFNYYVENLSVLDAVIQELRVVAVVKRRKLYDDFLGLF